MNHRLGFGFTLACVAALPLVAPAAALAASRLVVLPVVVGGGNSEPERGLVAALTEGLRQNPQWGVEQGDSLLTLAKFQATSVSEADLKRLATSVDDAAKKVSSKSDDAITALTAAREELRAAARKGPRGDKADDLAWRASTLLVAAYLHDKQETKARTAAEETALLFPGRKVEPSEKLPAKVAEMLAATRPDLGARLTLRTRPAGCEVLSNGIAIGKDPLEISVLQGDAYYFQARCGGEAPAPVAGAPAAPGAPAAAPVTSFPKKVVVPANETTRQDVLDAEFERGFEAEGMRRVRFGSTQERRQLEESYARRLAERFDADGVVLASVGELSGADWLNARLYTRSGYLNRQGLVRLEAARANALGRFLATGKDVPGVLKPEEAGALLAASRVSSERPAAVAAPWYSDVAGWSLVGVGIMGFSLGQWANSVYHDKQDEADNLRGDVPRQEALWREAQSAKFWGGIGTVGGLLFVATGVILLAVPEHNDDDPFTASVSPGLLPGGGSLTLSGRF
jgi:hypothetical protein